MTMRHRSSFLSITACLALAVAACSSPPAEPDAEPTPLDPTSRPPTDATTEPEPEPTSQELSYGYGVSAGHPLAVEAGMQILDAGGTAVDAAIATAFAVAVVEPFASGIGGGGAALVADVEGDATAYDYREVVPNSGQIPATGTGIPGFVAGMAQLHEDHGELTWADVLAPAIELAEEGFPVSEFLATRLASDRGPGATSTLEHFAPGGQALGYQQTLVQAELAATMHTLAQNGPESFYSGSLADQLATVDGIDPDSLASYEIQVSEPSAGAFGEYEVLSAAPALPGPALIQMLQVAEAAGAGQTSPESAEYVTLLSDAWQVARETTTTMLGDPAFIDVPVEELTDPEANASRAAQISHTLIDTDTVDEDDLQAAMFEAAVTASNTTHLSVVDSNGLTVSMTNTITAFWGSGQYRLGFFLNDQLTRFQAISSGANSPAPGRRSVSWAAPVIVRDDQARPVLTIGSPGGERIPNIITNVLVRWGLHDQSLYDAITAPRFIRNGGTIIVEHWLPDEMRSTLSTTGYVVQNVDPQWAYFGSVQALEIDHETGQITAARDGRREADNAVIEP